MIGSQLVSVLVPVAVDLPYTYVAERELQPGTIVAVPLGTRLVMGAVWSAPPDDVDRKKLRAVEHVFDAPPLPASLIRFVDWMADYTLAPRGMVLRMVLRSPEALQPEKPIVGVRLGGAPPERMTAARKRVLDVAADGLSWSKSGLAAAAGVSPGVVDGLLAGGTLARVLIPPRPIAADARPRPPPPGAFGRAGKRGFRSPRRRRGCLLRLAPRRRHRLRQDGGLFRSGRRDAPRRPAGAGTVAGDRADRRVSRPLRRALRLATRGMAFGGRREDARACLARGGERRGARAGRRTFGALPALFRARADRRR